MIEEVDRRYPDLEYMTLRQARAVRDIVLGNGLRNLLELGTFQGKSAAYMAAILEEAGQGRLVSLDMLGCLDHSPNVHEVLRTLGLAHRVEVRLHPRSLTMTLLAMLEREPRESFDSCYFDDAHVWDVTGFAFLLVDRMLRPGAWVLFDDLDWTLARELTRVPVLAAQYRHHAPDELSMAQVRKVFEILVRDLGYRDMSEPRKGWGLARKPGATRA